MYVCTCVYARLDGGGQERGGADGGVEEGERADLLGETSSLTTMVARRCRSFSSFCHSCDANSAWQKERGGGEREIGVEAEIRERAREREIVRHATMQQLQCNNASTTMQQCNNNNATRHATTTAYHVHTNNIEKGGQHTQTKAHETICHELTNSLRRGSSYAEI